MRFECEDIGDAARICASIGLGREGGFVDIEAKDNALTMRAREYDVWAQASVPASTPEAGRACVSARDFSHIARGSVSADCSHHHLSVRSRGTFSLPTVDAQVEVSGLDGGVEIDGGLAAIQGLVSFCDPNHVSANCHGVGFINGRAMAGNGVVYASIPCGGGNGQIVPASVMRAMPKAGRLFLSDDTWRVEAEGVKVGGQVLGDRFPDLTKQIGDAEPFAEFDANDLRDAISAASLGRAQEVVVSFDGASATVSGDRFTGAHVDTKAEFGCNAGRATCLFSVKQVERILGLYSGRTVFLSCDGRMFKFTPVGTGQFAVVGLLRDLRNDIPGVEP